MPTDIHTHHQRIGAIYNLSLTELRAASPLPNEQSLSIGIHPWDISADWRNDFDLVCQWASQPQVKMIGEVGFDKSVDFTYQFDVFMAHAQLAEEVQKPLVIHCVKSMDELLKAHKQAHPTQPWIYHGFRGKPQQAQQLLHAGLSLSFGEHFNPASVRLCPNNRLYMETDESQLTFEEIVKRIEAAREGIA